MDNPRPLRIRDSPGGDRHPSTASSDKSSASLSRSFQALPDALNRTRHVISRNTNPDVSNHHSSSTSQTSAQSNWKKYYAAHKNLENQNKTSNTDGHHKNWQPPVQYPPPYVNDRLPPRSTRYVNTRARFQDRPSNAKHWSESNNLKEPHIAESSHCHYHHYAYPSPKPVPNDRDPRYHADVASRYSPDPHQNVECQEAVEPSPVRLPRHKRKLYHKFRRHSAAARLVQETTDDDEFEGSAVFDEKHGASIVAESTVDHQSFHKFSNNYCLKQYKDYRWNQEAPVSARQSKPLADVYTSECATVRPENSIDPKNSSKDMTSTRYAMPSNVPYEQTSPSRHKYEEFEAKSVNLKSSYVHPDTSSYYSTNIPTSQHERYNDRNSTEYLNSRDYTRPVDSRYDKVHLTHPSVTGQLLIQDERFQRNMGMRDSPPENQNRESAHGHTYLNESSPSQCYMEMESKPYLNKPSTYNDHPNRPVFDSHRNDYLAKSLPHTHTGSRQYESEHHRFYLTKPSGEIRHETREFGNELVNVSHTKPSPESQRQPESEYSNVYLTKPSPDSPLAARQYAYGHIYHCKPPSESHQVVRQTASEHPKFYLTKASPESHHSTRQSVGGNYTVNLENPPVDERHSLSHLSGPYLDVRQTSLSPVGSSYSNTDSAVDMRSPEDDAQYCSDNNQYTIDWLRSESLQKPEMTSQNKARDHHAYVSYTSSETSKNVVYNPMPVSVPCVVVSDYSSPPISSDDVFTSKSPMSRCNNNSLFPSSVVRQTLLLPSGHQRTSSSNSANSSVSSVSDDGHRHHLSDSSVSLDEVEDNIKCFASPIRMKTQTVSKNKLYLFTCELLSTHLFLCAQWNFMCLYVIYTRL